LRQATWRAFMVNPRLARPERGSDGKRPDLRLHRRRRGLGGLFAGEPPVGGPVEPRAAVRGGRPRQLDLVPYPRRLHVFERQSALGLVLHDGARARPQRPADALPARQGDRRLVGHQRDDLYPRPGRRLRPLAATRPARLGLGRRAAVFPQARGSFRRRDRTSRRGPRIARRSAARRLSDQQSVRAGNRAGGDSVKPRSQHRRSGRHGPL
jgi:hypothetical protein